MRIGKRMDASNHGLINDDEVQAPLIPTEQDNEEFYRIEPSSQIRKNSLYFIIIIKVIIFRWYSCSICS